MKIVKIGAMWCSACLITNNALDKYIKENKDIQLVTLDYDFDEEEAKKYSPGNVLPVLIFFDNDKEILRLKGEKTYEEIKKAVGDVK